MILPVLPAGLSRILPLLIIVLLIGGSALTAKYALSIADNAKKALAVVVEDRARLDKAIQEIDTDRLELLTANSRMVKERAKLVRENSRLAKMQIPKVEIGSNDECQALREVVDSAIDDWGDSPAGDCGGVPCLSNGRMRLKATGAGVNGQDGEADDQPTGAADDAGGLDGGREPAGVVEGAAAVLPGR